MWNPEDYSRCNISAYQNLTWKNLLEILQGFCPTICKIYRTLALLYTLSQCSFRALQAIATCIVEIWTKWDANGPINFPHQYTFKVNVGCYWPLKKAGILWQTLSQIHNEAWNNLSWLQHMTVLKNCRNLLCFAITWIKLAANSSHPSSFWPGHLRITLVLRYDANFQPENYNKWQ